MMHILVFSVVSDFATPLPTNLDRLSFVCNRSCSASLWVFAKPQMAGDFGESVLCVRPLEFVICFVIKTSSDELSQLCSVLLSAAAEIRFSCHGYV